MARAMATSHMDDAPPTLAERMADYATGLRFENLPGEAVHEVKRRVIDSLGCALAAYADAPCAMARRVAGMIRAEGPVAATVWGTAHRTSLDWAAFANGVLVRYLDYNDTYLSREPAHPSDNIPAAIAVAEAGGASGRELIAAIVAAYEVQCRLCDAASLRAIGWDHVTYGAFSTAVAAGRLMGLDVRRLRHALGIAGVTSAALRQTRVGELSHWKGCAFANAARHGVYAAMLAREGMTGPSPIFEGDKGFERLVSGRLEVKGPFAAGVKTPAVTADDGCMILRTSIKCWPVEYHAQSAVEAALKLRVELGDAASLPSRIESVVVESHDAAVDIIGSEPEKWRPTHRETADHSLPYIVAAALVDGDVTLDTFSAARIADPALIDFVQRVKVERHAELSGLYPGAVGNIVSVKLRDGRTASRRVDHPCGHAANPMSDAAVDGKFHRLADRVIGAARAGAVLEWAWGLERAERVDGLLGLIRVE
jgi:2-methylcitrate dehydratase